MESSTNRRSFLLGLAGASAAAALTLAGCGSGGSTKGGKGITVHVTVKWPSTTTRYIAGVVKCIKVVAISSGDPAGVEAKYTVIPRPEGATSAEGYIYGVTAGDITVSAYAYADSTVVNGVIKPQGVVVASATAPTETHIDGDTMEVKLHLGSTIAKIVVTGDPNELMDAAENTIGVYTTETTTLTATAYDADGNVIPVTTDSWTWADITADNGSDTFGNLADSKSDTTTYTGADATPGTATITVTTSDTSAPGTPITTTVTIHVSQWTLPVTVTMGPSLAIKDGAAWKIDGGDWVTAASTTLEGVKTGQHTITCRAIDTQYNYTTPADITFRLVYTDTSYTIAIDYKATTGVNIDAIVD